MEPLELIEKFYPPGSLSLRLLTEHSRLVAGKALETAGKVPHLAPDPDFIFEASMLHDIAIFLTGAPSIGCHGDKPYICHGYLGREILENAGLPRHALVAERHVGVGITAGDIRTRGLPLPARDMTPRSIEEIIVCFADKFYSKGGKTPAREKPVEEVRRSIARYGEDKLAVFDGWLRLFGHF